MKVNILNLNECRKLHLYLSKLEFEEFVVPQPPWFHQPSFTLAAEHTIQCKPQNTNMSTAYSACYTCNNAFQNLTSSLLCQKLLSMNYLYVLVLLHMLNSNKYQIRNSPTKSWCESKANTNLFLYRHNHHCFRTLFVEYENSRFSSISLL